MTDSCLISAPDLATAISGSDAPLVLDVRWTLKGPDQDAYRASHIPGAIFVDLDGELASAPGDGGRHPLPDEEQLQELWQSVGIEAGRPVVVYDGRDSSAASRAWWLLRWSGHTDVRVLDGGFAAWERAELATESGDQPRPGDGSFVITPGAVPVIGIDEAAAIGSDESQVLLDARAAARYRGEVEPIDPVAGRIPGAANLPYPSLQNDDGTFLPVEALEVAFAATEGAAEVDAAYCGSGVSACVLVLAAAVTGRTIALYPGSYSEWCRSGRPVAVG